MKIEEKEDFDYVDMENILSLIQDEGYKEDYVTYSIEYLESLMNI